MIKVNDLDIGRAAAMAAGLDAGPIVEGSHERRCLVTTPGGWPATLYQPIG
jgi:hypothetical protein